MPCWHIFFLFLFIPYIYSSINKDLNIIKQFDYNDNNNNICPSYSYDNNLLINSIQYNIANNIKLKRISDISSIIENNIINNNENKNNQKIYYTIDPKKTLIKDLNPIQIAGIVSNFTIIPRDTNENYVSTKTLQLLLRHNMSEKHSKFITRCEESFCIVYFLCIEAGSYFINLLLDDNHIGSSPFTIKIIPSDIDASRTFAMSLDSNGKPIHPLLRRNDNNNNNNNNNNNLIWKWKAGALNEFTINPRDSYGNKISKFNYHNLSFSHNLSITSPLKMRSEILSDGRLKVIANTTNAVPFQLSIGYLNNPILNSPVDVSVLPSDVYPQNTIIQGTGLIDSYVKKQSEIIVIVRDKWNNLAYDGFLSATCHSPNCSLAIENHYNGTFSILFTPYKKELIQLSIRVNGESIPNSPFYIQVKEKEFPLPPLTWNFLGPFDKNNCLLDQSTIRDLGLCDYYSFKHNVNMNLNAVYPSTLIKGGTVSWRTTRINATGRARVKTSGTEFFGWAVGQFEVTIVGEYNVFCDGIYEYYINDISISGGSWHPVILDKGKHDIILLLSSYQGVGDFYCDFTPIIEDSYGWQVESIIDTTILPAGKSWFSIIQLVILYNCLQAIVGPMYYNRDEN